MLNNIVGVYCHIDPLIHRYLVDAAIMRSKEMCLQPFAYNFDIFHHVQIHVMSQTKICS